MISYNILCLCIFHLSFIFHEYAFYNISYFHVAMSFCLFRSTYHLYYQGNGQVIESEQ